MRSIFVLMFAAMAMLAVMASSVHVSAQGCTPTWSAGGLMPTTNVRSFGVYFPANGRFYAIGGRETDDPGSDALNPYEYNPATNTWTTKAAIFPDQEINNMACGLLTVGGTPLIYCVGGSQAGGTNRNGRVFSYNPVTDTITTLTAADNWPGSAGGTVLPGGAAVLSNKLYTVGGFSTAGGGSGVSDVWQFDPTAAVGAKWVRKADLPVPRGYVPAVGLGGFIYTAGGSNIAGTVLADSAESYKYDPAANTWTAIPNIPRATGETRAVVINNQVWVLGGGRTAPANPSKEVDIYDPATNTWSLGPPFMLERRNFPADSDGGVRIFLAGGYGGNPTSTFEDSTELFVGCAAGGATPTPTPPATPSPTPTPALPLHSRADFDGDNKTDVSVFRPSEGNWYLLRSTAGFAGVHWGAAGDRLVPGDYDNDNKTDLAVFRADANEANPDFYILNSSNGTVSGVSWGIPGDIPAAGDYDGDGRTDVAVYRPSNNTWYIIRSTSGFISATFGAAGDTPLVMNPDADNTSNIAVFRPGNNTWYIARTLVDPSHNFTAIQWGQSGDKLVPADYDGDNRDDVAVFRPSDGVWYVRRSSNGVLQAIQFGASGDVPVPGDYDGDGKDDQAVYRNGIWYMLRSTQGFAAATFGASSDIPVPTGYIP